MSVRIAKKGLGAASEIWRSVLHPNSLQAMKRVEIPQPSLAPVVEAMTGALVQQHHIQPILEGVPGDGMGRVPLFL